MADVEQATYADDLTHAEDALEHATIYARQAEAYFVDIEAPSSFTNARVPQATEISKAWSDIANVWTLIHQVRNRRQADE